jgi:hypothetical protein
MRAGLLSVQEFAIDFFKSATMASLRCQLKPIDNVQWDAVLATFIRQSDSKIIKPLLPNRSRQLPILHHSVNHPNFQSQYKPVWFSPTHIQTSYCDPLKYWRDEDKSLCTFNFCLSRFLSVAVSPLFKLGFLILNDSYFRDHFHCWRFNCL